MGTKGGNCKEIYFKKVSRKFKKFKKAPTSIKEVSRRAATRIQRVTASAFLKHEAKDSMKVKAVQERKNYLRKYSRCFNCLKKNERFRSCRII